MIVRDAKTILGVDIYDTTVALQHLEDEGTLNLQRRYKSKIGVIEIIGRFRL